MFLQLIAECKRVEKRLEDSNSDFNLCGTGNFPASISLVG